MDWSKIGPLAVVSAMSLTSLWLSRQASRASREARQHGEEMIRQLAYRIGRESRDKGHSIGEGKAHFDAIFNKDAATYQPEFEAGFAGQDFAE